MSIKNFLETKTIHLNELSDNFIEIKRIEIDTIRNPEKCYNDIDCNVQRQYKSEPWTKIFQCDSCNTINAIIHSDRMRGNHLDAVIIYKW